MNLGDLRARYRQRTTDVSRPYFWDDDEVDALINEAYHEAVDRGLVILDRDSFEVEFELGVTEYQLDPRIIRVREANIISKDGVTLDRPEPMRLTDSKASYNYQQFFDLQGFRVDEDNMLILATPPTTVMVIRLIVHRYPDPLVDDGDEPVIAEFYHEKMLDWAIKRGLLKNDADTIHPVNSDKLDAEFARTFGQPKTAQQHRQRRRHAARSLKTPSF